MHWVGGISGSGPSVFMLSKDEKTALSVEQMMKEEYQQLGLEHHTYVTTIDSSGVQIIED